MAEALTGRPTAADFIAGKAARLHEARHKPEAHADEAPEGYNIRGVSTLRRPDGTVVLQWLKTTKDHSNVEAVLDAFALAVERRGLIAAPVVEAPEGVTDDLLTVYPMGDPHIGMLSWHKETGQDFDLETAEWNLVSATRKLVGLAPKSRQALIINLGDFFHSDNMEARTARSGHALDVDSRWSKILLVGLETMVQCIDLALAKHECVRVINEIGNHDDHSSQMLSVCLARHYRNNPRCQVDISPSTFHWLEFGSNLIGVTHGHNVKPADLPAVMAYDQREAWGRTQHRYWYTGHVHHQSVKEYPGCIVETFRTLAARDAWHHSKGYRAGRSMVCDVLHRTRGRITRHEVGVEALD